MFWKRLFATKSLEMLQAEAAGENRLRRILGPIGLMNDPKAASGNSSGNDEFAELLGDEEEGDDEEDEGEDDGKGGVDAGSALINTGPVSIETPVDEPVTSGADSPDGSL